MPLSSLLISSIIWAIAARAADERLERLDLGLDGLGVLGQLAQQARYLGGHDPAGEAQHEAPRNRPSGSPRACGQRPSERSLETTGLSRNVRKIASATGMKIDWAK